MFAEPRVSLPSIHDTAPRTPRLGKHAQAARAAVPVSAIVQRLFWRLSSRPMPQLAIGLLLAVILPVIARFGLWPGALQPNSMWNTIAGIFLALVAGFILLKQMARFPGVRATSYVLPCFASTYFVALLTFFFFRLDYARSLFLISFSACIVWFFVAMAFARIRDRPRFAVVPHGDVARLTATDAADVVTLSHAAMPQEQVDALVADFRADIPGTWETFIADWVLSGRQALHVKQAMEMLTGRVDIEHLSENNFGSLDPGRMYRKIKAALDITLALLVLPLFAILTAIIGFAIRLDSPGHVIYRQERVGYRGKVFKVYKFRTMVETALCDELDRNAAMTKESDPRVTRFGALLRRSRVDEIPQIINVLRGEMSWIGPRPEALALSQWYEGELPFYRYRHVVRPGITGWAQINQGHVVEMQEVLGKLHYDFYYIRYFSLWLDAFIALRSVWIMLRGFGAR